jgi:hypothetical protein
VAEGTSAFLQPKPASHHYCGCCNCPAEYGTSSDPSLVIDLGFLHIGLRVLRITQDASRQLTGYVGMLRGALL